MQDHTIVAGYGTMGQGAVDTLLANGLRAEGTRRGRPAAGRGRRCRRGRVDRRHRRCDADATWRQVSIDRARAVVITCNRDDTATLVTLTARELNAAVPISVAVREAENAHLLSQSGATTVVLSSEAAGPPGRTVDARPGSRRRAGGPPRGGDGARPRRAARSTPTRSADPRVPSDVGLPVALVRARPAHPVRRCRLRPHRARRRRGLGRPPPVSRRRPPGTMASMAPSRSPNRSTAGMLDVGDGHRVHWRGRREPGRQAGGHPPRRSGPGLRRDAGSSIRPATSSCSSTSASAAAARRHAVRARRRPVDEHDGPPRSPTSSGCATTSASSAGWCGVGRGGRSSGWCTPRRIPPGSARWCSSAWSGRH